MKTLITFIATFTIATSAMAFENCGDPNEIAEFNASNVDVDVAMYDEAYDNIQEYDDINTAMYDEAFTVDGYSE